MRISTKATTALAVMSATFAYTAVATEVSTNKAQDKPAAMKRHSWDTLMTKDAGNSFQKMTTNLRHKHLPEVPVHLVGLAQSAAGVPANLANIVQKQHAEQVLDHKQCIDGDMFSITASHVPLIEGCFKDIGFEYSGESIYSQNGNGEPGQTFVTAFKDGHASDMSTEPVDLWVVAYSVSDVEAHLYCLSLDETASGSHPADVKTWYCDLEQTGKFQKEDDDDFDIECGCH